MIEDFESLIKETLMINKESTKNYVKSLDEAGLAFLYTKPFPVGDFDHGRENAISHLSLFISIANVLHSLSPSKVIDIGCGPGWLSEYLARLGFDMTGIDFSEDFIEIAEKRKRQIPYFDKLKLRYRVSDAHSIISNQKYDCAILYSSLHHFDEPERVLKNIYDLLTEKGFLIIHEGERPPKGSDGEKRLIDEMKKSKWLERPFFKEELLDMLKRAGFKSIEKLFSLGVICGLYSKSEAILKYITHRLSYEDKINFFIAFKNMPELSLFSMNPHDLYASIKPISLPEIREYIFKDRVLHFRFRVENTGKIAYACKPNLLVGHVTFAAIVSDSEGRSVIDTRTRLKKIVYPNEYIDVDITIDISPLKTGKYRLSFDLVCEQVTWFSKVGTKPYEIIFEVL
jgi:2-polyprenyl-3-methyl-5-hydroxy-6-metoxy-1,4-benzoquinol methylase